MSVAAGYEIIEWAYAELAAAGASDFLGSHLVELGSGTDELDTSSTRQLETREAWWMPRLPPPAFVRRIANTNENCMPI
jgi:hypothetical protein